MRWSESDALLSFLYVHKHLSAVPSLMNMFFICIFYSLAHSLAFTHYPLYIFICFVCWPEMKQSKITAIKRCTMDQPCIGELMSDTYSCIVRSSSLHLLKAFNLSNSRLCALVSVCLRMCDASASAYRACNELCTCTCVSLQQNMMGMEQSEESCSFPVKHTFNITANLPANTFCALLDCCCFFRIIYRKCSCSTYTHSQPNSSLTLKVSDKFCWLFVLVLMKKFAFFVESSYEIA